MISDQAVYVVLIVWGVFFLAGFRMWQKGDAGYGFMSIISMLFAGLGFIISPLTHVTGEYSPEYTIFQWVFAVLFTLNVILMFAQFVSKKGVSA